MDERAEQLHGLRHSLRKLTDLPVDRVAQPMAFEQFAPARPAFVERQPPQRAHEGDCLVAFHRRIQPALLGQIADQFRDLVRAVLAEDAAHPFVGIDNAQQHAQCGGLARAIGAENAVDRAFGHGDIHPVHRQNAVEPLDQALCLDSERARPGRGESRHRACFGKHGRMTNGWQ